MEYISPNITPRWASWLRFSFWEWCLHGGGGGGKAGVPSLFDCRLDYPILYGYVRRVEGKEVAWWIACLSPCAWQTVLSQKRMGTDSLMSISTAAASFNILVPVKPTCREQITPKTISAVNDWRDKLYLVVKEPNKMTRMILGPFDIFLSFFDTLPCSPTGGDDVEESPKNKIDTGKVLPVYTCRWVDWLWVSLAYGSSTGFR